MSEMRPGYWFLRFLCQGFCVLYLRARCFGVHRVPATGGAMLVSNHQSFVDPVLDAMALHREVHFMARDSLFGVFGLGRLIRYLNAFPVRRNSADVGAIKEALRRLKRGHLLVIYPEGARTADGRIRPMLPGLGAIAKKAGVPVIPTLIDGVFRAWPRHRLVPLPGDVIVEYGEPIGPREYAALTAAELMELVHRRLVAMQSRWHRRVPGRRQGWHGEDAIAGGGAAGSGVEEETLAGAGHGGVGWK